MPTMKRWAVVVGFGLTGFVSTPALASCNYDLNGVPYPTSPYDHCPYIGRGSGAAAPQGPTPEQQRAAAEAKDLNEATQDAWDRGTKAYHNGDLAGAVRYFREALSYDPDNADIKHNLEVAQSKLLDAQQATQAQAQAEAAKRVTDGLAARQAAAMAAQAPVLAGSRDSLAARNGFDRDYLTGVGGISASSGTPTPHGDPIVPPDKRTPKIVSLEERRARDRREIAAIGAELKSLDPAKDPVKVGELKQKRTNAEHDVHYVNLSIDESIKPPKDVPAAKPKS